MTFSIAAWHPQTNETGVAVSTANLAVGAVGYRIHSGVGVVVTQADPHPILAGRALRLMQEGLDVEDILAVLLKKDAYRSHRQIGLVSANGQSAAWSGEDCVSWAGHRTFPYYCVSGNMLVGEATIDAMAQSYAAQTGVSFAERLLHALEAGQAAGGDKRGRQSAALCVFSTQEYADLDLRVDDHSDPVAELRRIYEESQKSYYRAFRKQFPTHTHSSGIYEE